MRRAGPIYGGRMTDASATTARSSLISRRDLHFLLLAISVYARSATGAAIPEP